MTSTDLTPREKICCFTYFLTPVLNFSVCSKKTWRKAVFWSISPGMWLLVDISTSPAGNVKCNVKNLSYLSWRFERVFLCNFTRWIWKKFPQTHLTLKIANSRSNLFKIYIFYTLLFEVHNIQIKFLTPRRFQQGCVCAHCWQQKSARSQWSPCIRVWSFYYQKLESTINILDSSKKYFSTNWIHFLLQHVSKANLVEYII